LPVPQVAAAALRFAHFELQPHERRLLVAGEPAALGARALDVLIALAGRAGELVSKNELLEIVWPGLVVEENNLAVQVSALRKVLGGDIIATIPGRGYRFTARIEAAAGAPARAAFAAPAASAPERLKSNLPEELTHLVGRDADLGELAALIDRHRLLTIVGAGGIGKSALARALLRERSQRYAQGVCWVELAQIPSAGALPHALPGAIAASLGVRPTGADPITALAAAVAPLDVLIALDNAEHIYADVARVAEALLQAAPQLHLVVTSQAPLKAAGEQLYRLGSLTWPEGGGVDARAARHHSAVALFVERAQALDRRFALTDDNVEQVVALCRTLDGLPLAIELAAARLPLLGLSALTAGLDQRLRLLTTGTQGAPARQQTLRAALEWSHQLLTAQERAVLRRLAVFAGSASLHAIQQLAAEESLDEWTVLDALGTLVDRSFVALADDREAPRYRLLDTPRAFALEQLAASGEIDVVRARHAAALREHFERAYEEGWSGRVGVEAWSLGMERDLDNAREAFAWASTHDPACALSICASVLSSLPLSLHGERLAMWEATDPLLTDAVPAPLRARALLEAADLYAGLKATRACGYARQAVELLRGLDDRFMLYRAVARLAHLLAPEDEAAARVALAEMRALEVPTWPARRLLCGANAEQACASWFREPEKALDWSYRLMALENDAGSASLRGLLCVVDVELELRHAAAALKHGLELVARLQGTRFRRALNVAHLNVMEAWLANDNPAEARALAVKGWPEAIRHGWKGSWADCLSLLAALESRPRASALLRGFAEVQYAVLERKREVAEGITIERAERIARRALGDAEYERFVVEGKLLRDSEIAGLAFAEADAGGRN
jgi:predicted ATPase/DNA-binding winged helix-turn-helix (wHTH) protein